MPVKLVTSIDQESIEKDWKDGAMLKEDFDTAKKDFRERVLACGAYRMQFGPQVIPYSKLKEITEDVEGSLLFTFFGLDEHSKMAYGFRHHVGEVDGNAVYFPYQTEPTHLLKNNKLTPVTSDEWTKLAQRYKNEIKIKCGETSDYEYLNDNAGRMVILQWKNEVKAMYEMNRKLLNEGVATDLMIENVSIEHPADDGGNPGYRHGVAFYVRYKKGDKYYSMLDDGDYATIYRYKHKAIDYGHLSPPHCCKFERKKSSTEET